MSRNEKPHRPLLVVSAALGVLCLVSLGGLLFDDRELLNQPIWTKTFKFSVSVPVYLVTLAWMISLLPKARRWGWWLGTVVAAGLGMDVGLIAFQTIRGQRSHFNHADEIDNVVHNLMATGAYLAFAATLVVAILLSCQRLADVSRASAVRAGLFVSLVGMAVASLMFTPNAEQRAALDAGHKPDIVGAHAVGVADGGPGLPLLGWSTEGGDLRVPHFVGLHALQLLPLLAIVLVLLSRRFAVLGSPLVRRNLIRVCAAGYLALVVVLTWQAQRGQSLVHPDGATVLAWGGIAAVVLGGGALIVRHASRIAGFVDTAAIAPESAMR